ncbi:hypothetical protein VTI74DRAFT_11015 [Chaetomium olivicolor]
MHGQFMRVGQQQQLSASSPFFFCNSFFPRGLSPLSRPVALRSRLKSGFGNGQQHNPDHGSALILVENLILMRWRWQFCPRGEWGIEVPSASSTRLPVDESIPRFLTNLLFSWRAGVSPNREKRMTQRDAELPRLRQLWSKQTGQCRGNQTTTSQHKHAKPPAGISAGRTSLLRPLVGIWPSRRPMYRHVSHPHQRPWRDPSSSIISNHGRCHGQFRVFR